MTDAMARIADTVRGVASEKRLTQERVAGILGISRQAVNARFSGKVPFSAVELYTLAESVEVPISRMFPAYAEQAA